MNLLGGYAMIDLKGYDLAIGDSVTITGLNNALAKAMDNNKLILLCNARWEDDSLSMIPCAVKPRALNAFYIHTLVGENGAVIDLHCDNKDLLTKI